jgi:transcriptional regulator with PAS, ATPase and Fis domain
MRRRHDRDHARGGTILLDEIGDLSSALQSKLLRVIQEREVMPVGGRPVPIDVQILSATHHDLERAVESGRFREDLYFRLNVVPIRVPGVASLAERRHPWSSCRRSPGEATCASSRR